MADCGQQRNGQGAFLAAKNRQDVFLVAEKWAGRIVGSRKTGRALRLPKNA